MDGQVLREEVSGWECSLNESGGERTHFRICFSVFFSFFWNYSISFLYYSTN